MPVSYQEPTVEKGRDEETTERHPAYAQIGASRVSGRSFLYGSDFDHQHYVTISIHRSELRRDLSRDWPFAREEYIEVALSEAQWATFVSSMNQGRGVQCTLSHRDGAMIPQIPAAPKRQHQFRMEVDARLQRAMEEMDAATKAIQESGLSGKKQEAILRHLSFAKSHMSANIGFVASQFGEHIEKVTEHAKVEVGAYVQAVISRAGLTALQAPAPISLPQESQKD